MAINTLATATLFMTQLDKIAVQEATTGWMDANAGQVIYNGGSEVKIPKMSVQGMGDYDREAGYQRGSVTLEYETRKMTQDRGRLFQLDPMDINEANFIPTAGAVMGEFQRTQVVPEIDAYRISNTMNINTSLISNNNSYAGQTPAYIVIHNTDNYAKGANAKAHAKAQHDGNFKGYSAHVYVDDTEAYQALPYNRGAWHVGVNYGGRLFGTVNNRNSVGIEMCVQAGYNYEKAFQNTVQVCKQLMKQLGIPADRVVQHYDVCAKNCPSAIRAKGDWNRFKQLIGAKTATPTVDKYYRTRKSWADSKSQIGAYKSLENAKKEWKQGYTIYDWNGKAVYPVQTSKKAVVLTGKFETQLPIIRKGNSGVAVSVLQSVLGVTVDGNFGDDTETSLKVFQKNTGVKVSGTCGIDSWKKVIEHVKANTK